MRPVAGAGELEARGRGRPPRGRGRLRRPDRLPRALPAAAAPHRDPGARRRGGNDRQPRRARVLGPAPPPEGPRGGALGRRRPGAPRAPRRRRGRRRRGGRLRRRRHGRVPARRGAARVLLPRDEHPAPGRAPGDRDGPRPRPRRRAAPDRRRRADVAMRAREPRIDGHAIEVRLYAEDAAAGFLPQTGTVERIDVPGAEPFAVPAGDRPGRPAPRLRRRGRHASSAPTTTRCSPR